MEGWTWPVPRGDHGFLALHRPFRQEVPVVRSRRLALLLSALVLLVACGTDEAPAPEPAPDPADDVSDAEEDSDGAEGAEDAAPTPDEPAEDAAPADPPTDDADTHPAAGLERAVWVHLFDASLKDRDSLERVVEELERADATAVIAQVARRHDAYYRSEVLPATADPDLDAGVDVLAELTELAHEAGIEVHAWFSIAPTWHAVYDDLPAPAGWLPEAHGRSAPEEDRWVSRDVDGAWSEYLDPGVPEVHDHVAAVVAELADSTEVDGIHLDYVRYASEREGYHPTALERFRSETGASGTPAPDDAAWSRWRREQTRELVAAARAATDAAERDLALSAAVIAWGAGPGELGGFAATRTAREALQDWPGWVEEGLVDAVLPMVYFRDHEPDQAAWFEDWVAFQRQLTEASETRVVPGIAGWLNAPDAVLDQLDTAAEATDGVALYSYQQPADDPDAAVDADRVRPFWEELAHTGWGRSR